MIEDNILYYTDFGRAIIGDSLEVLRNMPDNSIDLVITSPPFALQRQKEYGNKNQEDYVDWLLEFTNEIKRVVKEHGSLVIDLGGAYQKGIPIRSLYNFKFLIRACDEQGWKLAEEFFWYNSAKLPSPIEWVNKRKIRVKDAVNTIWWLSKSDFPQSDIKNVLVPYSERMKLLIKDRNKFYQPQKRPSGHDISSNFGDDNNGAIPSNMLQLPNTESNSFYLRTCKKIGYGIHPARFPSKLPEFFIKMLTKQDDVVLDIFAGSNTTGNVAEKLRRKWLSIDLDHFYLASSVFRFLEEKSENEVFEIFDILKLNQKANLYIEQKSMVLF